MLKSIFILLLAFPSVFSYSQDLALSDFGFEHAYCRLYSYQNGHGIVYAGATGGVPDYTYLWTDLQTGESTSSSTWGGRNPGCYEITITDGVGSVLKDTVCVDSLNPIADFEVISDDLDPIVWGHIGTAPAVVEFENTSLYFANPHFPDSDTTFIFRPQGFEEWEIYHDYAFFDTYTYNYGGVFTASLIAYNKNGCRDTTHQTIGLFGPLTLDENGQKAMFTIATHSSTNEITIKKAGYEQDLLINIYSLSGQLLGTESLIGTETKLGMNLSKGIYIYEIVDPLNGQTQHSGKFQF